MRVLVEEILRGVAQMVARTVRDREVVGSNPAAPTIFLLKTLYFVVARLVGYLRLPVFLLNSRLEIKRFSLKNLPLLKIRKINLLTYTPRVPPKSVQI